MGSFSLGSLFFLWASSRLSPPTLTAGEPAPMAAAGSVPAPLAGTLGRGALLDTLGRAALAPAQAMAAAEALSKVLDPRTLKPEDRYEILRSPDGRLERLTLSRPLENFVVELGRDGAFRARRETVPTNVRERSTAGRLKGSLWESMRARGMDAQLIMEFADVFAWSVDFLTEPREGDAFAVAWEESTTPAGRVAGRRILAAAYDGRGTGRHEAVLFKGQYYAPSGESLRKAFLHAPLNFRRISSGFTKRRLHPVLRTYRPHLGIDYAAPTGTPVVSVGEGTVVFKGWKAAYGHYLRVRHNARYTSCYGHLSRYAKGIRTGSRVAQGQVIGYVGATGWATGPHLDFRVIQDGRFVNFLRLKIPPGRRVPAAEKSAFAATAAERTAELNDLLKEAGLS